MSSCNVSEHSFDDESVTTLALSEKLDDVDVIGDELKIEKAQGCEAWSQQGVQSSKPLLSSCSKLTAYVVLSTQICRYLLPSFFQPTSREESKPTNLHPTAHLDGMRGLAAFAVFLCHLSYGTWDLTHSYGSGESGENSHLLQLPIVRLLYSGPPMVAIFFVISGYALSYKPVKLMRAHQHDALMTSTTSSIFRRAIRLYLPCFASTFMVAVVAQCGLFALTEDFAQNLRAVKEDHLKAAPTAVELLPGWFRSMFGFVNIFDWTLGAGATHFDPHLWTIPVEYRCSLLLFLTHLLTARMSTRTRLSTLMFLLWWGAHWDRWDMTPFWAGQILAELHHIKLLKEAHETQDLSPIPIGNSFSLFSQRVQLRKYLYSIAFSVGCYLASFPDADGHEAPGYIFLNSLIPKYWSQKHRFWPNIGAVIIVWSAGNVNTLKKVFSGRLCQYLGTISFPLYVMHGPVINTFGYMTMQWLYRFNGTDGRPRLEMSFAIAALLTIAVVVWAADLFWRAVDTPCVKFSKWLESKFFIS